MHFFPEINQIEINPTELCNLTCTFCPRSTFYPNVNQHMSLKVAGDICKQMRDAKFTGTLSITGRGEPTLHPQFEELVSIFVGYGWKLKIHTNGKRFDKYADLILTHFHDIHYNCYDCDPIEVYEKYGHYFNVKVIHKPIDEWFPEATNRAGSFPTNQYPKDERCDTVFHKMFIDIDGTYRLCCEDWKEKISLGNIYEQGIVEYIENNEQLAEYRRRLIVGDRSLSPCNSCNYSVECDKYDKGYKLPKYKRLVDGTL